MDRRNLLRSLFALGGAATVLAIPKSSEAASLFDELGAMDAKTLVPDADLPAAGAEDAQWAGPPAWGRRCTWRIDRWGRRVRICRGGPVAPMRPRRCWWTVDRWGRRVRICR